jgi:hypothetical protein
MLSTIELNPQDLVPSVSIEAIVRRRDALIAAYRQLRQAVEDHVKPLEAVGIHGPSVMLGRGSANPVSMLDPEADDFVRKTIDSSAWAYLMNESGLRTFFDATARKEWDAKVYNHEVPPLTLENIRFTFEAIHGARDEYFDRGVIAVFKRLSWDYKTNQPFKFGKRIIMTRFVDVWGGTRNQKYISTSHTTTNELDDLVRIFSLLDGKPEPDHRGAMYHAISPSITAKVQSIDLEYFSIRWFLKGTGHITFKRPELVDRLNSIIAKHYPGALPEPR